MKRFDEKKVRTENSIKLLVIILSSILFSCGPTEKEIVIDTWENGNMAVVATYLIDKTTEKMIQKDIYTVDGQHFMSIDVVNNDTLRYYELPSPYEGSEFQGRWKGAEKDAGQYELVIDRSLAQMTNYFIGYDGKSEWTYTMTQEDNTIFLVWVMYKYYYTDKDFFVYVNDAENLTNEGLLLQRSFSTYLTNNNVDTLRAEEYKDRIFIIDDTLNIVISDSVSLKLSK